ncbi:DUF3109 family protein [Prosthecochloris sp. SCSIO W1101]|uniref:DUF3109 family protein n=1 Tax=Prosthecochloris sp. SCSIO W1101 TaxID=2992242 RepID=UPI00223CD79A|nr:DUF3109 family protein [Prosthecochloris sp. SCSIO W1101]UZJ42640.1 DUF3109 family protein [Prosthecochloris sp. SCSIO W1101]
MLAIDDVLIDDGVPGAFFSCDLVLCKGACCVEGELGAPVLEEEAESLREITGTVSEKLPEKNRRYIRRYGCLEIYQGNFYTRTIEGRECVFAFRDKEITFCAIEKRKPLSCRLFPIRIKKKFGLDYLVYERHAMCRQAVKGGIDKSVLLVDYVAEALIECYGLTWYRRLKDLLANSPMNYARH